MFELINFLISEMRHMLYSRKHAYANNGRVYIDLLFPAEKSRKRYPVRRISTSTTKSH